MVTKGGSFGLAPTDAQIGDVLRIIGGCSVPVILRPLEGCKTHFKLIGECYIHGLIDGDFLEKDPHLAERKDDQNVLLEIF